MSDEATFLELIRRVRAGDEEASTELVRRYEPAIRIAIRVRLTDAGLRRVLDSMDICQSVLGNFFVRAALGQFDLERPEQLLGLLVTMARNRLTNHALHLQAARRDLRRTVSSDGGAVDVIDQEPSPSSIAVGKELIVAFRSRLTPEERTLADGRASGKSWAELAAATSGSPDALRVRMSRAFDRVACELHLEG